MSISNARTAALAANKALPSAYYDGLGGVTTRSGREKQNPVFQKLEQDINTYVTYMKSRSSPSQSKLADESYSRPSDMLFDLWNKYEPLVPTLYYQRKVIEMGDFLVTLKEYSLADFQCFSRYLDMFGDIKVDEMTDRDIFKSTYFANGFDSEESGLTFRALMGKSICMFQLVKLGDPKLQNTETVQACIRILNFLRLVTQVILPKDNLCWLVFNGTVHIYSVCRHLMAYGHTSTVIEYLLWASMCMETSVVLLGKRYLTWRTTLYTAICQCYYDCVAGDKAEAFARRALHMINELSKLESMSDMPANPETEAIFRHATIKMAIMVFKRSAFESRKKPKGFLRPKTRANLKDAQGLPWPRTPTEKLLVDMFEGSSAQFLCIVEALSDTNKRTLITQPPAPDSEVEILDVYAELFMAAQEIICGGGGSIPIPAGATGGSNLANKSLAGISLTGVCSERSLIKMASNGMNGVPISAVVKLIKLAYCFEHWDVFDGLVEPTKKFIQKQNDITLKPFEKELDLMLAMQRLNSSHKKKLEVEHVEKEKEREKEREKQERRNQAESSEKSADLKKKAAASAAINNADTGPTATSGKTKLMDSVDDLMDLAKVLQSFTHTPGITVDNLDLDMVVDATLFLWSKCKAVFQKYQTGSLENWRYIQKMDQAGKWVYLLENVHLVLGWCGLSSVDPGLSAEIALRLSLVLEAAAACKQAAMGRLGSADSEKEDYDGSYPPSKNNSRAQSKHDFHTGGASSILDQPVRDLLVSGRNILELGLKNVSFARQVVALTDGKSIADISWSKELNPDLFGSVEDVSASSDQPPLSEKTPSATAVWNTVKDLHMELFYMYHRVCLKLLSIPPEPKAPSTKSFRRSTCSKSTAMAPLFAKEINYMADFDELVNECQKNLLIKAMLLMQKALSINHQKNSENQQRELLNEAQSLILKTQAEDRRLHLENSKSMSDSITTSKVPPAPILLSRTDTTMVFKPAPFVPETGEKVAWYRLFGRDASGSNVRVRLNDYCIRGCGDETPATSFCQFKVQNLTTHKKYVFAVSAYTADGKLIGGSIGTTSKPILASHPLPVQMAWAYLAQVAYQVDQHEVALAACQILWDFFVSEAQEPKKEYYITCAQKDFKLTLYKLNRKVLDTASPVLLRMFLTSIFISSDISTKQKQLYCDRLCDQGSLYNGQILRLKECQKYVVALELAGWLNEANIALQAAVQCYGLLAPLLYWRIPSIPVIQILERCLTVLQEIPTSLRQRRTERINDSLHHMTACMTYHLTKTLRTWGQKALATKLNDVGRRLLTLDGVERTAGSAELPQGLPDDGHHDDHDGALMTLATLKKKNSKKSNKVSKDKDDEPSGNSQLRALESHMLKLSKQGMKKRVAQSIYFAYKRADMHSLTMYNSSVPCYTVVPQLTSINFFRAQAQTTRFSISSISSGNSAQGEHELTGNEEPSILNAYIAYLPSRIAFKEVQKFKRRNRYLEFLVQVVQKAITEGFSELAIDWCEDALTWINKRNEMIIGSKAIVSKQVGAITVQGDDPKKFAAAMVEYNRQKEIGSAVVSKGQVPKISQRKRNKMKLLAIPANFTPEQRAAEEERQMAAIEKLALFMPDMFKQNSKRKRYRKICVDEMPWRAQLNIVLGLSHFGVFLNKLELKEKLVGNQQTVAYNTAFLDPEWFTFETAGTIVVGMDPGPSRPTHKTQPAVGATGAVAGHARDARRQQQQQQLERDNTWASGIERAAAAATGAAPPPLFPVPPPKPDSPRTPRSPIPVKPAHHGHGHGGHEERKGSPDNAILSAKVTQESLENTFKYFRRAIVIAHRGQHWTLLQNAVRALWNCAHTALTRAYTTEPASKSGLLTLPTIRKVLWFPFAMACEHWLDMMFHINSQLQAKAEHVNEEEFSFVGDVESEKGGSSLKFEGKLDDHTVIDLQFTRRLVLRTIELLFHEKKWEHLVDIGLKFTSLTKSRYVDQVYPMVILAQRFLADRIVQEGEVLPQLHFVRAKEEFGEITPLIYATELQLRIPEQEVDGRMKLVVHSLDYKAEKDPMAVSILRDNSLAKKLVSVPVDYEYSLSYYKMILEKGSYNTRALRHSRRLLILYLGGQQNASLDTSLNLSSLERSLDFVPHTAQPQPTVPPDLRAALFASIEDVQTAVLPKPQLNAVITSYEKTIEILLAHNQKSLASQAMHELGNLQYHNNNLRSAYKWWCEAVDLILGTTDAVSNWRHLFDDADDISSELLSRCGLWGCLLGSVITSNISQYILTSDLGMRTTCCFLSAYFFKALFRASLPHPTADRDYALYDIGEGFEVTSLIPGIDLLSDHFRSDGRSVVAALRWVTEELARGKYDLFVLPLLTLYQYFTTYVCRDLQRAIDGRILKVRVLTDLGLFAEAAMTLLRLLHGDRLPHIGDSNFRQVESKMPAAIFDSSKPLHDPNNLKIVELLIDKRLSTNLSSLFGPHLTCQLSIVQARLIIALADTISAIPLYNVKSCKSAQESVELVRSKTMATVAHEKGQGPDLTKIPSLTDAHTRSSSGAKSQMGPPSARDGNLSTVVGSEAGQDEDPNSKQPIITRFTDDTGEFSSQNTRTLLLNTGEKMVMALHDILLEAAEVDGGAQHMKPSELEMITNCKLLLADIARQRHHAGIAANTVFSALKILKSSNIFKDKKNKKQESVRYSSMKGGKAAMKREVKITDQQNNQFAYHNFQSRSRLDARLWLECRFTLVRSLMEKISGMGLTKGKITKVVVEIGDCRQYCEEGIHEASVCGDPSMLAQFTMQKVLLNLIEGIDLAETIPVLEEVLAILKNIPRQSISDQYLKSQALILLADLKLQACCKTSDLVDMITYPELYITAHQSLLSQMEQLGDQIIHYHSAKYRISELLSSPVSPMKNIYLPQVSLLVLTKLRLGHMIARNTQVDQNLDEEQVEFFYTNSLSILTTALNISQVAASSHMHVQAELYLALGRVQHQLYLLKKFDYHTAANMLIKAIQSSQSYDHDLGLIRQAYLELAMIYLHSSENSHTPTTTISTETAALGPQMSVTDRDDSVSLIDDTSSIASGLTFTSASNKSVTRPKRKSTITTGREKSKRRTKESSFSEQDRERCAAFLAIKCASQTAQAQLSLSQVSGDSTTSHRMLNRDAWIDLPQFMFLDLVGDYVIGEKRKVYKDWVEEQMAPLIESVEPRKVPTYEDRLIDAQDEAHSLNWIHYLGYQSVLRRMTTHSSFTVLHESENETESLMDQYNQLTVRYTVFSSFFTQRVAANHKFFCQYLPFYAENCVAPSPPEELDLTRQGNLTDVSVYAPAVAQLKEFINVEYSGNLAAVPADKAEEPAAADVKGTASQLSAMISEKDVKPTVTIAGENELTFQWYTPMLKSIQRKTAEDELLLLYALTRKDPSDKKLMKNYTGLLQLTKQHVKDLHDSLMDALQKAEIALIDSTSGSKKAATTASSAASTTSVTSKSSKTKVAGKPRVSSPKLKRDEAIEAMLRVLLRDIYQVFGLDWPPPQTESPITAGADTDATSSAVLVEPKSPTPPRLDQTKSDLSVKEKTSADSSGASQELKLPFEITRGSIKILERMFNPAYGQTMGHSKQLTWLMQAIPISNQAGFKKP